MLFDWEVTGRGDQLAKRTAKSSIFINIVGLSKALWGRSFVFNKIVGLTFILEFSIFEICPKATNGAP